MPGRHGYPPKHLRQLSFEQRYDDREADAGRDQVKQGGLRTDETGGYGHVSVKRPCNGGNFTWACLKVCMTKMVRPRPKM